MTTGNEVRDACMAAGITEIPHHDCSICGEWVRYTRDADILYFHPACGCSWSHPRVTNWSEAAEWIDMQSNEDARRRIAKKFGFELP